MTSYETVYKAFLAKILEDEWIEWEDEDLIKLDLRSILDGALPWFRFPRISLTCGAEGFEEDLDNEEIQILASYMKCEWLNRTILTWENVKPLYVERDWSQANLLDKFKQLLKQERYDARLRERMYYRSIKGKSYSYGKLAGGR